MAREYRPLRLVTNSWLRSGRGSVLGPDTHRRTHWWHLTLECGHYVDRPAKYRPLTNEERRAMGWSRTRRGEDALPPPTRARCDECRLRCALTRLPHHSEDIMEVYDGSPEPILLCGYHEQSVGSQKAREQLAGRA